MLDVLCLCSFVIIINKRIRKYCKCIYFHLHPCMICIDLQNSTTQWFFFSYVNRLHQTVKRIPPALSNKTVTAQDDVLHMCGNSKVVINLNFQISLLQSSTHWICPNLCARSPPPPPLLTSCNELKLLHEKSCSQPHYCEYLYAYCQECGVCKGGR